MFHQRGCFSAIYHESNIYVFGGINYTDKIMAFSERYCLISKSWHEIAPMNTTRKNASAVALNSDTIYVIGGSCGFKLLDTIEAYSISQNCWNTVPITLPNPVSFAVPFKITNREILILGGMTKEHSKKMKSVPSDQVLIFDTQAPDIKRSSVKLSIDVHSVSPGFYD